MRTSYPHGNADQLLSHGGSKLHCYNKGSNVMATFRQLSLQYSNSKIAIIYYLRLTALASKKKQVSFVPTKSKKYLLANRYNTERKQSQESRNISFNMRPLCHR